MILTHDLECLYCAPATVPELKSWVACLENQLLSKSMTLHEVMGVWWSEGVIVRCWLKDDAVYEIRHLFWNGLHDLCFVLLDHLESGVGCSG